MILQLFLFCLPVALPLSLHCMWPEFPLQFEPCASEECDDVERGNEELHRSNVQFTVVFVDG